MDNILKIVEYDIYYGQALRLPIPLIKSSALSEKSAPA